MSTGIPLPLSATEIDPSAWSVTLIWEQCPARASSTLLSITSWIKWLGRAVSVYIPGRLRTGSRPASTSIAEAS